MTLNEWHRATHRTVTGNAALIGVSRVTLHKYLGGRVMPRPATVERIAEITAGAVTATDLAAAYNAAREAR